VARLGAAAWSGFSTLQFGDSRAYLLAAGELARTGHYPRLTDPDLRIFRPPGYPLFLAAATLGSPRRVAWAKTANAAAGAAGAVVLALLAARILRRRSVALAAGFAAALDPSLVFLCAGVQSEPLFVLLLLGSAFFLAAAADRPSSNLAVLSGVLLGAAALTRPTALAAALLFLAAPLFDRCYPLRARVHLAGSTALGLAAALLPWTVRNLVVFGEPLLVNDGGALALYEGNRELAASFYDVRTPDELGRWVAASQADLRRTGALSTLPPGAPPGAAWREPARRVLAERIRNPLPALDLAWRKARDWLRPYPNPIFWPRGVVLSVGLLNAAILGMAAIGFVASPRPGIRAFVLVYLALTMVVHVATLVSWRYRAAYWEPALLVYGTYGAFVLLGGRTAAPSPGPAGTQ
jgi:hypothetical protein